VDILHEDYLKVSANLFKLRRNPDDRIEPVLLEKRNDPSGFLHDVLKTGYVIYDNNALSSNSIYEG
jgi:hypothetical protein